MIRHRRTLPTLAAASILLGLATTPTATAGAYKVMSVDQRSMLVLDTATLRRSGEQATATALLVRNMGFAEPGFYEHPLRTPLTVDCAAHTFAMGSGAAKTITSDSAVSRTADWVCQGVQPPHSLEAGYFGALARAYRDYVAVTPGVFFLTNP